MTNLLSQETLSIDMDETNEELEFKKIFAEGLSEAVKKRVHRLNPVLEALNKARKQRVL